jgi:hypothetical protein
MNEGAILQQQSTFQQLVLKYGTHFNIRLGEWLASFVLVSLSILMFVATQMFARSPAYFAGMTEFGGQVYWGIILALIGWARILALWINGRKTITPYVRTILSFLSCFVWWQLTISLFLSGVPGLAWAFVPWLLTLDMYNVFRSSADAREVYDNKRAVSNGRIE